MCSLPGASSENSSSVAFFSVHTFAWEYSICSSAGIFSIFRALFAGVFSMRSFPGAFSFRSFSRAFSVRFFDGVFSVRSFVGASSEQYFAGALSLFCALIDRTSLMGSCSGMSSLHFFEAVYSVRFFTEVLMSAF